MNENLKGKTYFEQISWGIWIWFFVAILCGSIYLAIWAPLGNIPALEVTLISIFGFYYLCLKMQTTTYIQDNFLYVNQAKIDLKFLKNAKALNEVEFQKVIRSDADPAAFLATNFWVKTGVKIEVKDKNDPTPYWLISSRNAVELAKKLS